MYFPWGKDVRLGKSFLWMTLGKGNYITMEKRLQLLTLWVM